MANYYVAKSYQSWPTETEPYAINGRMYIKVRNPKGEVKQVRAYTEAEYRRLYGETCAKAASTSGEAKKNSGPDVRKILGFEDGYIWIFKGDLERADYWFERTPECRYAVMWGWYIVSTESIPFDIPSCIEAVKLTWEKVGNTDGTLLPKSIIEAAVNELRFDNHPSQFQGSIGERLTLKLYLTQITTLPPTQYGVQYVYAFEDKDANKFSWKTGVQKEWSIGDEISCKAGVKEHETSKGVRITVLTRLIEDKKK